MVNKCRVCGVECVLLIKDNRCMENMHGSLDCAHPTCIIILHIISITQHFKAKVRANLSLTGSLKVLDFTSISSDGFEHLLQGQGLSNLGVVVFCTPVFTVD